MTGNSARNRDMLIAAIYRHFGTDDNHHEFVPIRLELIESGLRSHEIEQAADYCEERRWIHRSSGNTIKLTFAGARHAESLGQCDDAAKARKAIRNQYLAHLDQLANGELNDVSHSHIAKMLVDSGIAREEVELAAKHLDNDRLIVLEASQRVRLTVDGIDYIERHLRAA